jgi:hypothetical protein
MKKILFLFAMLVSVAASAQRTTPVTIKNTKADYLTKTVTFDLSWTGSDAIHRDEVWVFVDIQPITGVTKGSWTPATLVPDATTVTIGSGNQYSSLTYTSVSGNTRGVWVNGSATNTTSTFEATVKVTLASTTPAKFNACAYATDYPPNIASVSGTTYTLKGTPSFKIDETFINDNQYSGAITTLTDATGCPGCIAIRDFQISSSNVNIPCCPNLTTVNDYCRDLVADNAFAAHNCSLEVKNNAIAILPSQACPSGWRWPTYIDFTCLKNNSYVRLGAGHYGVVDTNACGSSATLTWDNHYTITWACFDNSSVRWVFCVR